MKVSLKSFDLLIFLLIVSRVDGKILKLSIIPEKEAKSSNLTSNLSLRDEKFVNLSNKSYDLNTSDQNENYVKRSDDSYEDYGNKNVEQANSYLKEVNYYQNREFGYEKKFHWDSDSEKEMPSKKIKKDLYSNENSENSYGNNDMIEVNKWNDGNNYDNDDNYNDENEYNNCENKESYRRKESYQNHNVEDEQKWFKNPGNDKNTETSNEDKDEDNYNNFNSPKFIVNYHKFKPWNKLIKKENVNNFENYNEKHVYGTETESEYNPKKRDEYNYNDFNDEYIRRKANHKKIISKARNGPKMVRHYYDRHVSPDNYGWIKSESHKSPFGYERNSMRNEINNKFVEMPFDNLFRYGLRQIQKNSNKRSSAKIKQYRYGF